MRRERDGEKQGKVRGVEREEKNGKFLSSFYVSTGTKIRVEATKRPYSQPRTDKDALIRRRC